MVGISGRLYSHKYRFDRLHMRKVSTFFLQMVMGGQQRDTHARTCGIGIFATRFVLGSDLELSVYEKHLFLPSDSLMNSL